MIGRIAVGELIFTEEDAERAKGGEFGLGVGSTAGNKGKSESLKGGEGRGIIKRIGEIEKKLRSFEAGGKGKTELLEKERAPPEEIIDLKNKIKLLEEKIPGSISEQIGGLREEIERLEKERVPTEEIDDLRKQINLLEEKIPASISEEIGGLRGEINDLEKERGAPLEEINKLNRRIDSLENKKEKIVIDERIVEEEIDFEAI